MELSSGGVVLTSKNFFSNSSGKIPLCKEYTIKPQNGLLCKTALTFVFIVCTVFHSIFVDYIDYKNKCCVISIFTILSVALIINVCHTVEKETLLLVVPLTLQITTTYIFWNESTLSLPWHALGDLMIMEVIMGQQVQYCLSIGINSAANSELDHVILFRNSHPPFKCLEILYKDIQTILDKNR